MVMHTLGMSASHRTIGGNVKLKASQPSIRLDDNV